MSEWTTRELNTVASIGPGAVTMPANCFLPPGADVVGLIRTGPTAWTITYKLDGARYEADVGVFATRRF